MKELEKRQSLIAELERLHREQRGWQRATADEKLDYDVIAKIPTENLEQIVELLKAK